jgi:hypothetical protein
MLKGAFAFEDCLLKHYIRSKLWLPLCKERLQKLRKGKQPVRRLKYFTFCAVGALDVLLLDREKIIRQSNSKEFDTVYFFDRNNELVIDTRKRIPGAVGFPGDFVEVVLQTAEGPIAAQSVSLDSPADLENVAETRQSQNTQAQLQTFIKSFPFDVINLDVEQYIFRPKEELPGKLTNALRKIFEWQKREGVDSTGKAYTVDEFTLMFTTQVGPSKLPETYIKYLRDTCLQQNLDRFEELKPSFLKKSKGKSTAQFFEDDFDAAFKLAVPKSLVELALESDWHIDGEKGVEVYQFDRTFKEGSYRMLHMAMTIRRQSPERAKRGPGQKIPADAQAEHRKAIKQIFDQEVIAVESLVVGDVEAELNADLENLFEHRKKYYTTPSEPAD